MSEAIKDLDLYPHWKQAAQDFLAEFKYGDLVSHEWLEGHFGMPTLSDRQKLTAEEFCKRQFEWLGNVESFKAELLNKHQVCLQAVRGEGYRWVPPSEQTKLATQTFEKDAKKVFASASSRLRNVRVCELTEDQQKDNLNAQAKLASLRGMARKALR